MAALVLGQLLAVARPATASPGRVARTAPLPVLPAPAVAAAKAPSPLLAVPPAALTTSAPAPMSVWRKLGFGLVLTGPALVGTGVYLGAKARDQSKGVANFCLRGCGETSAPQAPLSRLAEIGPWLLLGTGAAALVGGGTLLWTTRSATRVHVSVGMRAGRPLALLKGSF